MNAAHAFLLLNPDMLLVIVKEEVSSKKRDARVQRQICCMHKPTQLMRLGQILDFLIDI